MKVKYKFDHIDSEADSLSLKAYGVEIANFKKADFGENWEDLLGQKFELNPYLVGDLDKLQITGLETNDIVCNSSQTKKDLWKEYSRNKIDSSMLSKRLEYIDNTKPIQITDLAYENKYNYYNTKLTDKALLDLSKLTYNSINEWNSLNFANYKNLFFKLPTFQQKNTEIFIINLSNYTNLIEIPIIKDYSGCYGLYLTNNNFIEQIPEELEFGTTQNKKLNIANSKINSLPQKFSTYVFSEFNIKNSAIEKLDEIHITTSSNTDANQKDTAKPGIFLNFNTGHSLEINKLFISKGENMSYNSEEYRLYRLWYIDFGEQTKINYLNVNFAPDGFNINKNTELGVVHANLSFNKSSTKSYTFSPIKAKAFPASLFGLSYPKSTATPNDGDYICWVDDIDTPEDNPFFVYFKKIANINIPSNIKFNTLKKDITEETTIEVPVNFLLNSEYPYEFVLDNIELIGEDSDNRINVGIDNLTEWKYRISSSNSDVYPKVVGKSTIFKDNKITFKIKNLYNIQDNKILKMYIYFYCSYNATIDGYPFKGKIDLKKYEFNIIFNLNEGANISFDFEDDDGNPLNLPLEPSTEPNTENTEPIE